MELKPTFLLFNVSLIRILHGMFNNVLSFPLRLLVLIYQRLISPLFPPVCRYDPTCSHYMLEALRVWGPIRGTWLGLKRIVSCHPWGGSGQDPVPPRNKKRLP